MSPGITLAESGPWARCRRCSYAPPPPRAPCVRRPWFSTSRRPVGAGRPNWQACFPPRLPLPQDSLHGLYLRNRGPRPNPTSRRLPLPQNSFHGLHLQNRVLRPNPTSRRLPLPHNRLHGLHLRNRRPRPNPVSRRLPHRRRPPRSSPLAWVWPIDRRRRPR